MDTPDWAVDDAKAVLARIPPNGLQHITIRDREGCRGVLPWTSGAPHASAEGLRLDVFRQRANRRPVTNIIRVKDAAAVRHRDAAGNVHRKVVGVSDPLRLAIPGLEVEILDIVFGAGSAVRARYVTVAPSGYDTLTKRTLRLTFADGETALVFVKVKNDLPLDTAASVAAGVLTELNLPAGSVAIRPDHWFYGPLFRGALPFLPIYETPPAVSYHLEHPTTWCFYAPRLSRHVCQYER